MKNSDFKWRQASVFAILILMCLMQGTTHHSLTASQHEPEIINNVIEKTAPAKVDSSYSERINLDPAIIIGRIRNNHY